MKVKDTFIRISAKKLTNKNSISITILLIFIYIFYNLIMNDKEALQSI